MTFIFTALGIATLILGDRENEAKSASTSITAIAYFIGAYVCNQCF